MSALRPKEVVVETLVSKYALSQGVMSLKLNVSGRRGWPDRIYLYEGKVIFIEFKREGEQPRKLQEYIHGQLRKQHFDVYVVDTFGEGRSIIDHLTQGGAYI